MSKTVECNKEVNSFKVLWVCPICKKEVKKEFVLDKPVSPNNPEEYVIGTYCENVYNLSKRHLQRHVRDGFKIQVTENGKVRRTELRKENELTFLKDEK